jgi:hypothetical protein
MITVKWDKGRPIFPKKDWDNVNELAGYIGALEAELNTASRTLVDIQAKLKFSIQHDEEAKDVLTDWSSKHPYKAEVMSLLNRLAVEYVFDHVFDGEEDVKTATLKEAAEAILSVDEARLYVIDKANEKKEVLFIVLGNESGAAVCDYSCCGKLDTITQAHYDEWEGK